MLNFSPAATDLGLGDGSSLADQLKDQEEERRKKLFGAANTTGGTGSFAASMLGLMGGGAGA